MDGPSLDILTFVGGFFPLILFQLLHYTRYEYATAMRELRRQRRRAVTPEEIQREDAAALLAFHADPTRTAPVVNGRFWGQAGRNPSNERYIDLGSLAVGARLCYDIVRIVGIDDGGLVSDSPSRARILSCQTRR